jgi:hypothetical protein
LNAAFALLKTSLFALPTQCGLTQRKRDASCASSAIAARFWQCVAVWSRAPAQRQPVWPWAYPATLTLHQRTLWVDGKQVPISPGMAITAEIKTGKRRIIEFLSSRLGRVGKESLRER